jgi:hypothetical protein
MRGTSGATGPDEFSFSGTEDIVAKVLYWADIIYLFKFNSLNTIIFGVKIKLNFY